MMKTYILMAMTIFYTGVSEAKVNFQCYSMSQMDVQTFQYGSSNCSVKKSPKKNVTPEDLKDGDRDILCVYRAACKPSPGNAPGEPPKEPVNTVVQEYKVGLLKASLLTCKGTGKVLNGLVIDQKCPTPTACNEDVFYNFSPNGVTGMDSDPISVSGGDETPIIPVGGTHK